jgi:hypothetical protein
MFERMARVVLAMRPAVEDPPATRRVVADGRGHEVLVVLALGPGEEERDHEGRSELGEKLQSPNTRSRGRRALGADGASVEQQHGPQDFTVRREKTFSGSSRLRKHSLCRRVMIGPLVGPGQFSIPEMRS